MQRALSRIYVTDTLMERTGTLLASFGGPDPTEGVVYWFGFEIEDRSIVTTLMVPNTRASFGCVSTTAEDNADVLTCVVGTPLVLIGQAHSHPGWGVRHSEVDDRETFPRFEGAISVVVPHFARKEFDLKLCGVHRFIGGVYRMLRTREVPKHLVVIPGERDFRN